MTGISVGTLRRLALGGAMVVVFLIAVSYGWNAWQAARARRLAPPVIPTGVRQQAAGFTFSRSEKGQTLFTVRASRTKDFKGRNRSLLEDVSITIFGKQSNHSDHIHTDRCEYDTEVGVVECAGEVVLDLEGSVGATVAAASAVQRAARNPLHLETSGVSFNQSSGIAHTDQPVRFSFPLAAGRADGLTYNTRAGIVELHRNIEIEIQHTEQKCSAPITLRGSRLRYTEADRRLSLEPPLSVTQSERQLTAQNLSLYLDERLQAQRAEAAGGVDAKSVEVGRTLHLRAVQVAGLFASQGSGIERLVASGGVRWDSQTREQKAELDADRVELRFDPARQETREIEASGNARFDVTLPKEGRSWSAPAISLEFRPGGRELARGWSAGDSLFQVRPVTKPGELRRVRAPRFELAFDGKSRLEEFRALGGARVDVLRPDQATQMSTSDQLFALFHPVQGTLKEADQVGHFRFEEGERKAAAERAHYDAASETATLVGQPALRDESTQTTARLIFLNQRTGEVSAEQNVRTTYLSSSAQPASHVFHSGEPVHIAADRLRAQRATGEARYEGHCRMWQGENVIQADAVELYQKEKKLIALGKVGSLFLERRRAGRQGSKKSPEETQPLNIRAERLTYFEAERRAMYEGGVVARDGFGTMRAEQLQIFFNEAQANEPVEIERALATGTVVITQPGRWARGEQAEYFADEEKIVLSGGTPTVADDTRGATTARRLTFYVRDDRILADSGEGSRTLTKHRVAK